MLRDQNDTIAAIATPVGEAGISVVRLSGIRAIELAEAIFTGKNLLGSAASHTIHYGKVVHPTEGVIDDVLVSIFRRPHSYTGEDVIEISCHGSYFITNKILETVIVSGARLADPGEFTQRAFLSGKMDLMQAEAVADLIHSKTALAHKASLEQLNGALSKAITGLRQRLIDLCSLLELELDFAEEGIELADQNRSLKFLDEAITEIENIIGSFSYGRIVRDGVKVVLAGSPNAGKSSLLNILLKENRAIVSELPGTTRDVIEEAILIDGLAFRLIDTAGLRPTTDRIEQEGVRRSKDQISNSDLILLLVDSSVVIAQAVHEMIADILENFSEKSLIVVNKIDIRHPRFERNLFGSAEQVQISCLKDEGIDDLTKRMVQRVLARCDPGSSSVRIQSERHRDLLRKTNESLRSAKSSLHDNMSGEFVAVDLRAALDYLGEIIGITTPEDVLNNIFAKFCIGK